MRRVRLIETLGLGALLAALPAFAQQPGQYHQNQGQYTGSAPAYAPAATAYPGPPAGYAPVNGYAPPASYAAPNYPPPGYAPPAQPYATQPTMAMQPAPTAANAKAISVSQWFSYYDQIRHQAQMSPQERQRADSLLSRGVSILMPGDEKAATKALLVSMVGRYQNACQQLQSLPQLPQTMPLHHAYYNYFATAGQLFNDYVRVQNNLFVTDAATGQPVASSLLQRKQMLEGLEHQCKAMDAQARAQLGVAPYAW